MVSVGPDFFEIALAVLLVVLALTVISASFSARMSRRLNVMEQLLARQSGILAKLQGTLRARAVSDAVAQNTEIIFQDLLQHISPIAKAIEVAPRDTEEHPLWRTLGGLIDEYARNPFVLENLRRLVKLDSDIARSADAFLTRSEKLLRHLADNDPDGLLGSTFTDGLLGQAMTLLSQAKQLAQGN